MVDPYVKVYYTNKTVPEPIKFATTEVATDQPNPEYITIVSFVWKRGAGQKLVFKVKDSNALTDETLGEAKVDVDEYVTKGQKTNVSLSNGGSLLIQKTTPISFRLYARNLPKMDTLSQSDPYVICYWKRSAKGDEIPFYTTKVITDMANPDWNETIEFPNYIKGTDLWWVFKVYDHDGATKDDDLGEALVEIDPYAANRQTKRVRIGKTGTSELAITPV